MGLFLLSFNKRCYSFLLLYGKNKLKVLKPFFMRHSSVFLIKGLTFSFEQ